MITRFTKVSKRATIVLAIAVFSVVGIVACGGDDITGSRSASYTPDTGGPTGPTGPIEIEPTTNTNSVITNSDLPGLGKDDKWEYAIPNWAKDTYYNIYIPYWGRTNVSYKDTTTLNKLYRQFIENGNRKGGTRWFIRDGGNKQGNALNGSYYYFDKNLDIRYGGKTYTGYHQRLIRRFLGAVIINYSQNEGEGPWSDKGRMAGTWTIGGLYETMINKLNDWEYGKGYFQYDGPDKEYLRIFLISNYERNRGDVAVVVMNEGYSDGNYNEFGVDLYANITISKAGYRVLDAPDKDWESSYHAYRLYLGQNPAVYTKKLTFRTNLAWAWGDYIIKGYNWFTEGLNNTYRGYQKFTYFAARPESWHLE